MKETSKKQFSVKWRMLLISIVPAIVISFSVLITGIVFMKSGMENEILKALISSAFAYRDTGMNSVERDKGDNSIELNLKKQTGYDFTWFDYDTRKNSSIGSSVIGTRASSEVIQKVIKEKQPFTSTNVNVVDKKYLVAYVPVFDDDNNVVAMAFTGVSRDSVEKQINKSVLVMLAIVLVFLTFTVIVAVKLASSMSKAIISIKDTVYDLSEGSFHKPDMHLNRSDEIGDALNSTNTLIDKLTGVIKNVHQVSGIVEVQSKDLADTSTQISQTAESVSIAVQQIAKGATEQANAIQTATENISELSDAMQNVAMNTEQLSETVAQMDTSSLSSVEALQNLSKNMTMMEESVTSISQTMDVTNEAVNNVNQKVDGITGIATQTNLLALNAAIEAARSGEAGKGFSVVAEEIGKLASQSANTANEIRSEMNNLLKHSHDAIDKTNEISNIARNVEKVLNETVGTITELISNVSVTVDSVNNISELTKKCDAAKVIIVDAMSSLSAISEENAASSEETATSMEELNNTVSALTDSSNNLQDATEKLDSNLKFFNI